MGTYTANYNLFMPTVGETGWGTLVNTNFSTIDTTMKSLSNRITAVENEVNGALSCTSVTTSGKITGNGGIAGTTGTFSGAVTAKTFKGIMGYTLKFVSGSGYPAEPYIASRSLTSTQYPVEFVSLETISLSNTAGVRNNITFAPPFRFSNYDYIATNVIHNSNVTYKMYVAGGNAVYNGATITTSSRYTLTNAEVNNILINGVTLTSLSTNSNTNTNCMVCIVCNGSTDLDGVLTL